MIRVVIADDQPLLRAGFRLLLDATDGIEVVGEAGDGEHAIILADRHHPDLILMDIRMPVLDGLEATRRITADPTLAEVKILILTTFDIDEHVFQALRAGASGFLAKDTEPDDLIRAVRLVAAGQQLLSPTATHALISQFIARPAPASDARPAALSALTDREREVMTLVAEGLSNEEIATRLVLSPATAKTHVSRILTKLAARDRAQLVVLAYQSGLMQAPATRHPPHQR
jgi:DNA-binding NarL/FixJ family response regulator